MQRPVTLSQKDCAEPASHPQIPRTKQNFKLGSQLEEHHLWIFGFGQFPPGRLLLPGASLDIPLEYIVLQFYLTQRFPHQAFA